MHTVERLRLRPYNASDLARLTQLLGDARTMVHWPEPLTAEQARDWHQRAMAAYTTPGYGRFVVELNDGATIGDAGIMRVEIDDTIENDLGYIIDQRYWRRGYGLEAARACLELGRRHGQRRIVANMAADNYASVRVAAHLGFRLERSFVNPRNRNKETLLFVWEEPASGARLTS